MGVNYSSPYPNRERRDRAKTELWAATDTTTLVTPSETFLWTLPEELEEAEASAKCERRHKLYCPGQHEGYFNTWNLVQQLGLQNW